MGLNGIINIMNASLRFAIPCFGVWLIIRSVILYKIKKVYTKQTKKIDLLREIILHLFVLYLFILYGITVYRYGIDFNDFFNIESRLSHLNLKFLEELAKMLSYGSLWHVFYNVVGNVVWFIPLGFLVPFTWKKKRGIFTVLGVSLMTSFSIELMQFIFMTGISDIDDLFFNTLGGLIGYMGFKMGQAFYRRGR